VKSVKVPGPTGVSLERFWAETPQFAFVTDFVDETGPWHDQRTLDVLNRPFYQETENPNWRKQESCKLLCGS
jgi:hypothetical protein